VINLLRDLKQSDGIGLHLIGFLLVSSIGGILSDLFVVLLKSGQIFSGLAELSLFHTLSDVPVDESSLGVHQVELCVDSGKDLSDSGGIAEHDKSSLDLSHLATWDSDGGLVVDTALESGGAPVYELDGLLGLDDCDGSGDILGDDVSSVHQTASHVFSSNGVASSEHAGGLEDAVGELSNGELLASGLIGGDERGERAQQEMNSRVWDQVSLELVDVDVQRTLESERASQAGNDLRDASVEIGVVGLLNLE